MFDERPVRADTAKTQADRQPPLQIHIYEPMCRRGRRRKQLAHAARPHRPGVRRRFSQRYDDGCSEALWVPALVTRRSATKYLRDKLNYYFAIAARQMCTLSPARVSEDVTQQSGDRVQSGYIHEPHFILTATE